MKNENKTCLETRIMSKLFEKLKIAYFRFLFRTIEQKSSNSKYVLFAFFHAYENLFHKQNVLSFIPQG